jgi:two-component system, cell cycle sensor histidine kinase and response regulator CckA
MVKPAHPTPPIAPTGSKSPAHWILLVDDEPAMRQMIETVLDSQSWSVRVADGAVSAMATVNAAPTPPSLLICDVLMPGIDGLQLTRRLLARLPQLKVILISGHLMDLSWWPTDLREICFLTKPFSNEQLIQAVKQAITDSSST